MKCYNPRLAFVNPNGGRPIFTKYTWSQFIHWRGDYKAPTFNEHREPLKIPCGKCEACALEIARQKAVRCVHEFKSSGGIGAFLTLTYNNENLPENGSYNESDIVAFVKRLRDNICRSEGCKGNRFDWEKLKEVYSCRGFCTKIKTFGCAEYGSRGLRPHFHLLIFGFDFPDRTYWRGHSEHGSGHISYRSITLDECWGLGHAELGSLTYQSASYTARYTQKKIKKNLPEGLKPEKSVCVPRRRGLGRDHFDKYFKDMYAIDAVIVNDRKQGIPRYYDNLLKKFYPDQFEKIKNQRKENRPQDEFDNSQERMNIKKIVHKEKIKRLRRSYEE